jgi:hypothetical protein
MVVTDLDETGLGSQQLPGDAHDAPVEGLDGVFGAGDVLLDQDAG